ncbi:MAG: hypothetical protein QOE55_4066 [Acidobacteriaceae bacterium]|jgi:hypothetical protein|nr:hypothetical protein [Acidobacteriaceae bacterium]
MLVGRCSLELSDRKLQRKIKSHKLRAKPPCPALSRPAPARRGACRGGICSSADLSSKRRILCSNRMFILPAPVRRGTGAYPDFLPRCTGQGRVCAFLLMKGA